MSSMYFMGPPSLLPDSRTGAAEIDRPPRDSPAPFPSRSPTHDRVGGRDVVGRRRPEATMTNPGDDIYGSAEHQAFRDTVRRFVQTELVPRAREFDELGRIDKSLYRKIDRKSTRLNSSHTVTSYAVFRFKQKRARAE